MKQRADYPCVCSFGNGLHDRLFLGQSTSLAACTPARVGKNIRFPANGYHDFDKLDFSILVP